MYVHAIINMATFSCFCLVLKKLHLRAPEYIHDAVPPYAFMHILIHYHQSVIYRVTFTFFFPTKTHLPVVDMLSILMHI